MKNFEYYKDKFMQYESRNLECIASEKILGRKCYDDCRECRKFIKEWLYKEYKEPIKLTDGEKAVLKNLPKKYKWIARDKNNNLYLYVDIPRKIGDDWGSDEFDIFKVYNNLFKFIKWEDEEPYSIEELLKE